MFVRGADAFEEFDSAGGFGWKELEFCNAEREGLFDIGWCHHAWCERQVDFHRCFDHIGVKTGRDGKFGAAGFGTFQIVNVEQRPSSEQQFGPLLCQQFYYVGCRRGPKCNLCDGQPARYEGVGQRQSGIDRINGDYRHNCNRSDFLVDVLMCFHFRIPD